jgi:hypothetical protein
VVLVIIAVAAVAALLLQPAGGSACNSTWSCAASYPIQVAGNYGVAAEQCASSSTYLYCLGGLDANGGPHSEVYVGTVAASGNITGWTPSPVAYPTTVSGQSCVLSSGYMYCVGGSHDSAGDDVASSYYAQVEGSGGLGAWFYTTPYPIPVDAQSCVTSSSYVYCVGGNNETDGTDGTVAPSNSVWYAQLTSSGIGRWSKTTAYPANSYLPSCFTADSDIFCLGGVDSSDNPLGTAYYASISSTGVGEWIPTSAYPLPATGQACAVSDGSVYCVGGATSGGQYAAYTSAVYSAPISSSGIGSWKEGPDYPVSVGTSCAIASTRIYCVGGYDTSAQGEDDYVYFAPLSSI